MRTHKCTLSALTLAGAMTWGAPALAADLPKEGTFSGTFTSAGTWKGAVVGKDRYVVATDENGLYVGTGFLDRMTAHCFGTANGVSGLEQFQGYCVLTDPSGDQIVIDYVSTEKHPPTAKAYGVATTITTGTGKYTGISG